MTLILTKCHRQIECLLKPDVTPRDYGFQGHRLYEISITEYNMYGDHVHAVLSILRIPVNNTIPSSLQTIINKCNIFLLLTMLMSA